MKKKKRNKKPVINKRLTSISHAGLSLSVHTELTQLKKFVDRLNKHAAETEERLQDIEIHINLLTRLITTLCIEKLGMRVGVLKRLIKKVEKEAIRDSQIMHLESLYQLPSNNQDKKGSPPHSSKNDPWEDIS